MLTYIVLGSFTDQGIRTVKDTTKRADAAKEMAARIGVKMREIYWTQGQYDLVTLCEADDEAAISAFGLAIGVAGQRSLPDAAGIHQGRDERHPGQAALAGCHAGLDPASMLARQVDAGSSPA